MINSYASLVILNGVEDLGCDWGKPLVQ